MISIENLSFQVKNKWLLREITAQFEVGKTTLIVGPNGAGKSTLIKLLSQEMKPKNGSIFLNGENLDNRKKIELAQFRAVLSQNNVLAFPMLVSDVVAMGRYPHFEKSPSKIDTEICVQAMKFFEVEALAKRNFNSLSGGEKQRVHFARVAAQIWPENTNRTKILLLDEPLTYLDVFHQYDFMDKLKVMAQMQPMIIVGVVHDLNLALKYADEILLLNNGKIHDKGITNHVITAPNIETVFKLKPTFVQGEKGQKMILF